jgi:threonylcarbamoyladenosine tRNA methylthiotransferase MtaB
LRSFHIQSFGCRASQADGAAIAHQLAGCGLTPATSESADLVVLNSCTVTASADHDLEKAARRTRRENPAARILVTGCYAQAQPGRVAELEGVTWVVGNSHKDRIADIIGGGTYHGQVHWADIFARGEFFSAPIEEAADGRARPNLKIQDGCNNRCSFCIIPSVRGTSRSAQPEWVIGSVQTLAERYAEVVLTGINLGRWGREWGGGRQLVGLLRQILDETSIRRIRLSSIEPMDWTDDLIEFVASEPRMAKHIHAPLQSGSDTVLRRMYRKYRPRHYRARIESAYAAMPQAAFGADVMTGFPGETDAEFADSVAFIESLPFTYLHAFTYSERPGTRAASMDQVPVEVRRERTRVLRDISDRKTAGFRRRLLGRTLSVVTLGGTEALSSNYVPVKLASPRAAHQIAEVTVHGFDAAGMSELPAALP